MGDSDGPRSSWKSIPISIATGAVIVALAAIIVALLRPSPPRIPTAIGVIETKNSISSLSKTEIPPSSVRSAEIQTYTVSRNLAGPLRAAKNALIAGKYPEAIATLEAANATQMKSPYAQHVINQLLEYAYVHVKNYPAATKVVESELNDGFLTPPEIEKKSVLAAQLNYLLKNYDKAIQFGNQAIKAESTNPTLHTLVAQAYYLKDDWNGAVQFEETFVSGQIKTGRTPDIRSLQLLLGGCLKLADKDCEARALEKLVAYYPSPTYRNQLELLRASR